MDSLPMESLSLKAETGPPNISPSDGEGAINLPSIHDKLSDTSATPDVGPTTGTEESAYVHTSSSSGMNAISCNSNNVNTGNKNSVIVGGNTLEIRDMVVNAGGDVHISLELTQRERTEALIRDGFNKTETLPDSSTLNPAANPRTRPDLRRPNNIGVGDGDNASQRYCESVAPSSRSHLIRITPKNIMDHVPKTMHQGIAGYMCASHLFSSRIAIPLWKPSPSLSKPTQNWRRNVYIGDVGFFNNDGGFETLFNVFETKEQNRSRRCEPPENFVPYPKDLSEAAIDLEPVRRFGENQMKIYGFMKDATKSGDNSEYLATIRLPTGRYDAVCTALHAINGFTKITISQAEEGSLIDYIRRQQTGWYEALENRLHGRSLTVISTSYRASSWAIAAATKSSREKKIGMARLSWEKVKVGDRTRDNYFWSTSDDILTKNGPSPDYLQRIESYFRNSSGHESDRDEIEECHVVAVEAFHLQEKTGSWIGGSMSSKRPKNRERSSVLSLLRMLPRKKAQ
ncbi:hypothetical protein BDZ97DRAFT_1849668 [Flammula alnicola]|nr:hypothetical protein BDZ97DRAFT_1849668 [Flammula alnicola]